MKILFQENLEFIKTLPGGSHCCNLYIDKSDGSKWVVKEVTNDSRTSEVVSKNLSDPIRCAHATSNELLATLLYEKCGVHVPEMAIAHINSRSYYATAFIPNLKKLKPKDFKTITPATHPDFFKGFVVDLWLGNYDVVGEDWGNILLADRQKLLRLDLGGALLFYPRGEIKSTQHFNEQPSSFLEGEHNIPTRKVFLKPEVLDAEIIQQGLNQIMGLSLEELQNAIEACWPEDAPMSRPVLYNLLIERRKNLHATLIKEIFILKDYTHAKSVRQIYQSFLEQYPSLQALEKECFSSTEKSISKEMAALIISDFEENEIYDARLAAIVYLRIMSECIVNEYAMQVLDYLQRLNPMFEMHYKLYEGTTVSIRQRLRQLIITHQINAAEDMRANLLQRLSHATLYHDVVTEEEALRDIWHERTFTKTFTDDLVKSTPTIIPQWGEISHLQLFIQQLKNPQFRPTVRNQEICSELAGRIVVHLHPQTKKTSNKLRSGITGNGADGVDKTVLKAMSVSSHLNNYFNYYTCSNQFPIVLFLSKEHCPPKSDEEGTALHVYPKNMGTLSRFWLTRKKIDDYLKSKSYQKKSHTLDTLQQELRDEVLKGHQPAPNEILVCPKYNENVITAIGIPTIEPLTNFKRIYQLVLDEYCPRYPKLCKVLIHNIFPELLDEVKKYIPPVIVFLTFNTNEDFFKFIQDKKINNHLIYYLYFKFTKQYAAYLRNNNYLDILFPIKAINLGVITPAVYTVNSPEYAQLIKLKPFHILENEIYKLNDKFTKLMTRFRNYLAFDFKDIVQLLEHADERLYKIIINNFKDNLNHPLEFKTQRPLTADEITLIFSVHDADRNKSSSWCEPLKEFIEENAVTQESALSKDEILTCLKIVHDNYLKVNVQGILTKLQILHELNVNVPILSVTRTEVKGCSVVDLVEDVALAQHLNLISDQQGQILSDKGFLNEKGINKQALLNCLSNLTQDPVNIDPSNYLARCIDGDRWLEALACIERDMQSLSLPIAKTSFINNMNRIVKAQDAPYYRGILHFFRQIHWANPTLSLELLSLAPEVINVLARAAVKNNGDSTTLSTLKDLGWAPSVDKLTETLTYGLTFNSIELCIGMAEIFAVENTPSLIKAFQSHLWILITNKASLPALKIIKYIFNQKSSAPRTDVQSLLDILKFFMDIVQRNTGFEESLCLILPCIVYLEQLPNFIEDKEDNKIAVVKMKDLQIHILLMCVQVVFENACNPVFAFDYLTSCLDISPSLFYFLPIHQCYKVLASDGWNKVVSYYKNLNENYDSSIVVNQNYINTILSHTNIEIKFIYEYILYLASEECSHGTLILPQSVQRKIIDLRLTDRISCSNITDDLIYLMCFFENFKFSTTQMEYIIELKAWDLAREIINTGSTVLENLPRVHLVSLSQNLVGSIDGKYHWILAYRVYLNHVENIAHNQHNAFLQILQLPASHIVIEAMDKDIVKQVLEIFTLLKYPTPPDSIYKYFLLFIHGCIMDSVLENLLDSEIIHGIQCCINSEGFLLIKIFNLICETLQDELCNISINSDNLLKCRIKVGTCNSEKTVHPAQAAIPRYLLEGVNAGKNALSLDLEPCNEFRMDFFMSEALHVAFNHEFTIICACFQIHNYLMSYNKKHPYNHGQGPTEGINLLSNIELDANFGFEEYPTEKYTLAVQLISDFYIQIWISDIKLVPQVTEALRCALHLPRDFILLDPEAAFITLFIPPLVLVERMKYFRQNYQGCMVEYPDGSFSLAMAKQGDNNLGYSFSGGHINIPYSMEFDEENPNKIFPSVDIIIGLEEFGFIPEHSYKECLANLVVIENHKQNLTCKISAAYLQQTAEAKLYCEIHNVPFYADPLEFDPQTAKTYFINEVINRLQLRNVGISYFEQKYKEFYEPLNLADNELKTWFCTLSREINPKDGSIMLKRGSKEKYYKHRDRYYNTLFDVFVLPHLNNVEAFKTAFDNLTMNYSIDPALFYDECLFLSEYTTLKNGVNKRCFDDVIAKCTWQFFETFNAPIKIADRALGVGKIYKRCGVFVPRLARVTYNITHLESSTGNPWTHLAVEKIKNGRNLKKEQWQSLCPITFADFYADFVLDMWLVNTCPMGEEDDGFILDVESNQVYRTHFFSTIFKFAGDENPEQVLAAQRLGVFDPHAFSFIPKLYPLHMQKGIEKLQSIDNQLLRFLIRAYSFATKNEWAYFHRILLDRKESLIAYLRNEILINATKENIFANGILKRKLSVDNNSMGELDGPPCKKFCQTLEDKSVDDEALEIAPLLKRKHSIENFHPVFMTTSDIKAVEPEAKRRCLSPNLPMAFFSVPQDSLRPTTVDPSDLAFSPYFQ